MWSGKLLSELLVDHCRLLLADISLMHPRPILAKADIISIAWQ